MGKKRGERKPGEPAHMILNTWVSKHAHLRKTRPRPKSEKREAKRDESSLLKKKATLLEVAGRWHGCKEKPTKKSQHASHLQLNHGTQVGIATATQI
jgi:hypothetical protein